MDALDRQAQHRGMVEKLWPVAGYVIGGVLLFAMFELLLLQSQVAMIPYSDFKILLVAGKVTEATVGPDTIDAVIDLRGAEKLLPAAEYKDIKKSSPPQEPGPPLGGLAPAFPPVNPQQRAAAGRAAAPGAGVATPPAARAASPDLRSIQTRPVNDPQLTLDALGKARGVAGLNTNDEREQTLNQLLVQMDGFDTQGGVIILAATNRPEILDPALLRPGRFDRHVAIDRPDIKGREEILKVHARNVVLAPEVDLAVIAAKTPGFAGADLANIVNEAALHAARENKAAVDMRDFDEAIDRGIAGLEKRNRVMNPKEKETVAYHEAGHALVAESRPHADRVNKISIIPRGIGALGYTQQLPTEDRYLLKRGELLDRLDVLLGGRVAEELVYGDVSTGAQDDLERATDMARHMVTQYGMSERLGQVTFDSPRAGAFLSIPEAPSHRNYSEETAKLIDEEIASLIRDAHARVQRTLTEKRSALDLLARMLLEHEVLDRAALEQVLRSQPSARLSEASFLQKTATRHA